jgi:hypothetical protein
MSGFLEGVIERAVHGSEIRPRALLPFQATAELVAFEDVVAEDRGTRRAAAGGRDARAPEVEEVADAPHPPSAPSPRPAGRRVLEGGAPREETSPRVSEEAARREEPSPRVSGERVAEGRVRGAPPEQEPRMTERIADAPRVIHEPRVVIEPRAVAPSVMERPVAPPRASAPDIETDEPAADVREAAPRIAITTRETARNSLGVPRRQLGPAESRPYVSPPAETAEPTVRITIGRVDVRALVQPAPARPAPQAERPRLSLEEYLRARNGRGER